MVLIGAEGSLPCGTALRCVVVDKLNTLLGNAVDFRYVIAYGTTIIVADISPTDIISPYNQNIGFVLVSHDVPPPFSMIVNGRLLLLY